MMKRILILLTVLNLLSVAYVSAQTEDISEFYLGNDQGWVKIGAFRTDQMGGCCNHANIKVDLQYVNTRDIYSSEIYLRFRVNTNSNQDFANWQYTIIGDHRGDLKFKKIGSHQYELWAFSPYPYGKFKAIFHENNVSGANIITTFNSKVFVEDTGQPDVDLKGDLFIPSGNVKIGEISSPTNHKLSVGGSAIFEEVVVKDMANWPDYVFEKDYPIISIDSLSNFIEMNGHLPGIPKASEVHENGISVGEMNKLLLEKIEELSLYVIEQNKEINYLKNNLPQQD